MTLGVILDGELCEKKGGRLDSEAWKILENSVIFEIKRVMIGSLKNYDFWWINRSMCCLSNSF